MAGGCGFAHRKDDGDVEGRTYSGCGGTWTRSACSGALGARVVDNCNVCDLLVRCLAALNGLCKLGLEGKLFDELIAEYKAAIGDEPLVDIIVAKRRSSTVQGIDSG